MKNLILAIFAMFSMNVFANDIAPQIELKDLKAAIEKKEVTVIDVNSEKSYKSGHIPTAFHFASNSKNLSEKLPKDKGALIVAYCGGPMCTAWEDAATEAKKLGYTNVKHFKGGISGWKKAGMKTES